MQKFLRKTSIFLLILFSLAIFADILISSLLKRSDTYASGETAVWNDLIKGNISSDILIYGSSRAWTQIDPFILEEELGKSCYNLGIDGHNFHLQKMRHDYIMERNKKPEMILYSVDLFTLEQRPDLYNYQQFLPFALFNNSIRAYTSSYKGMPATDFYIPLLRYFGEKKALKQALKTFKGQNSYPLREKGFASVDLSWNSDLENARKRKAAYNAKIDTAIKIGFEKFLMQCQNEGIMVILIYSAEYKEGQSFTKNRDDILKIYRGLSEEYRIPFLDYSNDSISMEQDYFYNSQHLNKTGVSLFTKKLASDIKEELKE